MTMTVRIWSVGDMGPWGKAHGRFIQASQVDGGASYQFWTWDTFHGELLASRCQQAHDAGVPITVQCFKNQYGYQLVDVLPTTAMEATA